MYYIGVDVGGTNLKIGLIENKSIVDQRVTKTNALDVIRQIVASVKELVADNNLTMQDIAGVGVGFPGMMKNGRVIHSPNIQLDDCPIQAILQDHLGVTTIVKNDGDFAAFAEHEIGAGVGSTNMIMLTIGTGIGGGIIINNEIYQGRGGAGELGHILCVPNGKQCRCGRHGCAEQYVSLSALHDLAVEKMAIYSDNNISKAEGIRAIDIMNAYHNNDECAKTIVMQYVDMLTDVVLNYCNIFRPDTIVIGGGLTYASDIIEMVAKNCEDQNFGYIGAPKVKIVSAMLGNDAGILGSVLAIDKQVEN